MSSVHKSGPIEMRLFPVPGGPAPGAIGVATYPLDPYTVYDAGYLAGLKAALANVQCTPIAAQTRCSEVSFEAARRRFIRRLREQIQRAPWQPVHNERKVKS